MLSVLRRFAGTNEHIIGNKILIHSYIFNRCAWISSSQLNSEPHLSGSSSPYFEQMYESWLQDSTNVHPSWAAYFTNVSKDVPPGKAFVLPPSVAPTALTSTFSGASSSAQVFHPDVFSSFPVESRTQSVHDTSRLMQLIRAYQTRGHEVAKIDPLGLPKEPPFTSVAMSNSSFNLDYRYYGFTDADLNRVFDCRAQGLTGFLSPGREPQLFRDLLERLNETYCGSIGVEYMHISNSEACNFIRDYIETPTKYEYSKELKKKILVRTARAQLFENFCHAKFSTSKRFGLDGTETMIVGMKAITKKASRDNVNSIVIGMPHRGRLNVLVNVMHKPLQQMMSEFQGFTGFGGSEWGNTGDVKYHLGVEFDHYDNDSQRSVHMVVLANPSHLETVDPVVVGQARAQQYYSQDVNRDKVIPVMLHGDASFAGQGVVYETIQMSKIPSYAVGGTIHIVVNNQIGFTTNPADAGSGRYCTDIAKSIDAPVFHVNADDPESVTFVSELAFEYRQRFKSDVFIDLVGYRRFGHNELDMPKFTQPLMYNLIAKHKPVLDVYAKKLIDTRVIIAEELEAVKKDINDYYTKEYENSKTFIPCQGNEYSPQWKHMAHPTTTCPPRVTGVPSIHLKELGKKISTLPPDFTAHPTVAKLFKARAEACESGENVDFGLAETLAYASLLSDGFHIRISGQDVQRGTFSHRHAVAHEQTTFKSYNIFDPLKSPHTIEINNSLLSEYAALGYEIGYSLEHPDSLVIWEAQFGDFANGAQIIIDQFIASGEVKWHNQSGIVMMLPHGYDGQGPEHSSARIERFLQLCDDREDVIHPENWDIGRTSVIQQHNIQVVNCTTPSNTFHVLRRQMHRGFRKPLIMITPKKMLKLRAAFCYLSSMDEGTKFQRYIANVNTSMTPPDNEIERLIVCSGQVYYDLDAYRTKHKQFKCALARVEQLSPFPFEKFIDDVKRYPNLKSVVWAQEEPMNAGPWSYTSKRIESSLRHLEIPNGISRPIYAGRDCGASTAVGDSKLHAKELDILLENAFNLNRCQHSYAEKYVYTL